MGKSKFLAQELASLEQSGPKDYDPEDDPAQRSDSSGSEDGDDGFAGNEHYATVGKSKLRTPEEIELGPQYSGSRISRKDLLGDNEDGDEEEGENDESKLDSEAEGLFADPQDIDLDIDDDDGEIDSEAAFDESDDEKFKDYMFRGSNNFRSILTTGVKGRPTAADFMSSSEDEEVQAEGASEEDETDEDVLDADAQHAEVPGDESDESQEQEHAIDDNEQGENDDESAPDEEHDLDKVSEDESNDADEDDEKTRRAELRKIMNEEQKSVVATISKAAKSDADKGNAVLQQRKAFDSLLSVRIALQKGLSAANSIAALEVEEKDDVVIVDEPYQAAEDAATKLWNTLDGLRQELIKAGGVETGQKRKRAIDSSTASLLIWEKMQDSELTCLDNRQTTLEKWSNKVKDSSALPLSRKLHNTQPQSKLASLQDHIAKKVQDAGDATTFDDTKFYKTLLNNFVDQRRMDAIPATGAQNGSPAQFTVVKEAKMRKKVDTKASKGRKMRFTVHEKLQNFMAPEDKSSWESEATDRLFGTLLGQKMTLGEEMDADTEEHEDELPLEDQGLMLFRS